jgi:hypothetical protein
MIGSLAAAALAVGQPQVEGLVLDEDRPPVTSIASYEFRCRRGSLRAELRQDRAGGVSLEVSSLHGRPPPVSVNAALRRHMAQVRRVHAVSVRCTPTEDAFRVVVGGVMRGRGAEDYGPDFILSGRLGRGGLADVHLDIEER